MRLNHLGQSVSPDATLGMVDRLAEGFDDKVMQWMQQVTSYHAGNFLNFI